MPFTLSTIPVLRHAVAATALTGALATALAAHAAACDGVFLVSSGPDDQVRRYDDTGAFVDVFVPTGSGGVDGPQHMTFDDDGRLYVAGYWSNAIHRYDGCTGAFIDVFAAGAPILNPAFVDWRGGRLIVSSLGSGRVLTFAADGTPGPDLVEPGHVTKPHTVRDDGRGHLLVADGAGNRIVRFDGASGAYLDDLHAGAPLAWPLGLVVSRDGAELLVSNWSAPRIERFDLTTGAALGPLVADPALVNCDHLAFAPDGRLMVTVWGRDQVRTYDAGTGAFLGVLIGDAALDGPNQALWVPRPCAPPGDVDGDGLVTVSDLLEVLSAWGPCAPICAADLDGNGIVGVGDLLLVLAHWT